MFGRESKCNYILDDPDNRGAKQFKIYSKKHFRIYRVRPLPVCWRWSSLGASLAKRVCCVHTRRAARCLSTTTATTAPSWTES